MSAVSGNSFDDESDLSSVPDDGVVESTEAIKLKPAKMRKVQDEHTSMKTPGEKRARVRKTSSTAVTTKRAKIVQAQTEVTGDTEGANGTDEPVAEQTPSKKRKRATKVKVQEETVKEEVKLGNGENGEVEVKEVKKKQQRTKRQKVENMEPLEERTVGSKLRVGAHVSIAGGVHHSIPNFVHIGANAFAMFLKNQRKWDNPALDPGHATLFTEGCKNHNIDVGACCLPHGSYLVNLAHGDEDRKNQAYDSFRDDLTRCHKLGIKLYNFHPGNSNSVTREEGIGNIAKAINKAHNDPETGEVIPLLETMASLGNTIGGTFKDIAEIIEHVENKSRVGVCLDTCHAFAAGYDLRTPETYAQVMEDFDNVIGLQYLKALHINDSKAPFASHRDLHARIGTGYLGLQAFHNIVNDERLHGLPMVLETPIDIIGADGKKTEDKSIWAREIKMLEKLIDMDVEGDEFKDLALKLQDEGKGERERVGDQVERKKVKDDKPKKKRGKKKATEDEEMEDGVDDE